ncbi:hypothetical protein ACHHRT_12680 [Desulfurivibrio sp. D14AmB]|uniref:hypothetical protein n=1 Tax=Desulfurivibrio sp. D14AmB TaxID=3374370 RepID=UPI00376F344D
METTSYKVWLTIEKIDLENDVFENVAEVNLDEFDNEAKAQELVDRLVGRMRHEKK